MTAPKAKACPECGGDVSIYVYESGWRRAECDQCEYIAMPAGNIIEATRNHNTKAADSTRVGKRAAGRMLDGVIHDARPEVR